MPQSHQVFARPRTIPGRIALWLVVGHIGMLALFFFLAIAGTRGGEGFFDNLTLAIPILLAGAFGITAGGFALFAILMRQERSIFDWLTLLLGLFVAWFAIAELLSSH
jgi:hypothetical protein